MPAGRRHQLHILKWQIHHLVYPVTAHRDVKIIRRIVAVIILVCVPVPVLHRHGMLHFPDQVHRDTLANERQSAHTELIDWAVLGVIQMITVSHGQTVDHRLHKLRPARCQLIVRKTVLDKQIHIDMVQFAVVKVHLRSILMGFTV